MNTMPNTNSATKSTRLITPAAKPFRKPIGIPSLTFGVSLSCVGRLDNVLCPRRTQYGSIRMTTEKEMPSADLILENATVLTMDDRQPAACGVAVKGNRIMLA